MARGETGRAILHVHSVSVVSSLDAMRAAESALALVAARHAGKISGDTLAAVLDAAVNLQFWIEQEEASHSKGESGETVSAATRSANGKRTQVRNRGDAMGSLDHLHAPAKTIRKKRNSVPSKRQ